MRKFMDLKGVEMDTEIVLAKPGHTRLFWVAAVSLFFVSMFIVISSFMGSLGFPLDDAWIHQTYARNFALRGEWAFTPGMLSGGSTSPLWTVLLSIGYLLGLAPVVWAALLGFFCLVVLAIVGEQAFRQGLQPWYRSIPWMGILLASEWHLVWAALSGMETILYALIIVLTFHVLMLGKQFWMVGLLLGVVVWIRPDGLTLLGPIVFVIGLGQQSWKKKILSLMNVIGIFSLIFLPYLVFNRLLSNAWMPTTFYAKQAEYAVMTQLPILQRLGSLIILPMVGVGILLLPGFVFSAYMSIRKKNWVGLGAVIWWLGYNLIYAINLPVTYQHGRYLIPTMPIYFILAGIGTAALLRWMRVQNKTITRVLSTGWFVTILLVGIIFGGLGAVAYAEDTAIIETEMVATARWIADNTSSDSLIAAHDIGALGYFGGRPLVDMAGLVTPEVIPFIRDEQKLTDFLNSEKIDYLVTFPDWYPKITNNRTPVYVSGGKFSPKAGGENMAVYQWR